MLDYVSRVNDVPLCWEYEELRSKRLPEKVYPPDVLLDAMGKSGEKALEDAEENAIPEFKRFNIIEGDVRDAI